MTLSSSPVRRRCRGKRQHASPQEHLRSHRRRPNTRAGVRYERERSLNSTLDFDSGENCRAVSRDVTLSRVPDPVNAMDVVGEVRGNATQGDYFCGQLPGEVTRRRKLVRRLCCSGCCRYKPGPEKNWANRERCGPAQWNK